MFEHQSPKPLSLRVMTMYCDMNGTTVLIIGEVLPETLEYREGLRFFDTLGIKYRQNGSLSFRASPLDLVKEASESDIEKFALQKPKYDLEQLAASPVRYIPADHPDFEITPTGKYVNRMGLQENMETAGFRYRPNGRRFADDHLSMDDLLFQIRDSI